MWFVFVILVFIVNKIVINWLGFISDINYVFCIFLYYMILVDLNFYFGFNFDFFLIY